MREHANLGRVFSFLCDVCLCVCECVSVCERERVPMFSLEEKKHKLRCNEMCCYFIITFARRDKGCSKNIFKTKWQIPNRILKVITITKCYDCTMIVNGYAAM